MGLTYGFEKEPSLVPGRIFMLIADAGREGGPIGLCGTKKLDLLLSVTGVGGRRDKLSTVRSESEGREDFFGLGVERSWGVTFWSSKGGLSSRRLCREAERKPSKHPSSSRESSVCGVVFGNDGCRAWARREVGLVSGFLVKELGLSENDKVGR